MIIEWSPARPKKKTTALIRESWKMALSSATDRHLLRPGMRPVQHQSDKDLYAMRGLSEKRPLSIIFKDIKEISDYAVLPISPSYPEEHAARAYTLS